MTFAGREAPAMRSSQPGGDTDAVLGTLAAAPAALDAVAGS
jgi:hypothetical protein